MFSIFMFSSRANYAASHALVLANDSELKQVLIFKQLTQSHLLHLSLCLRIYWISNFVTLTSTFWLPCTTTCMMKASRNMRGFEILPLLRTKVLIFITDQLLMNLLFINGSRAFASSSEDYSCTTFHTNTRNFFIDKKLLILIMTSVTCACINIGYYAIV
jgi:hypothetical protein